ncbi:hypothetical protein TrLO_g14188 [Triparma laevis f. longispina]|uniref:FAM192A/Fyv6 N-terminal domain-containing protein n=1 Tax=Triparma laevis f. longispina TaxID=1714387 RepID=A0A9W7AMB1_9STRA|nr:hypothetical protein TrLO_g14188 [Triparma laevis f. longispina]
MSLNFVASAVLSSGDGIGHNEETKIENEDLDNLRRKQENSSGVGLFDQLQKNKDEAEEAFNQKRSDLMGVRPLDDEDVQHINSYNEAKANKRKALNEEDNAEVEIFKRMKEMKQQSEVVIEEKEVKKVETRETAVEEVVKLNVIIKKKKKRVEKKEKKVEENKLVGLLGGYGSDSD